MSHTRLLDEHEQKRLCLGIERYWSEPTTAKSRSLAGQTGKSDLLHHCYDQKAVELRLRACQPAICTVLNPYKAVRLRYGKQHFDWLCQGPRKPLLDCQIVSSCFLQAHFAVDVVGYSGSMPLSALSQDSNIRIHYVPEL